MRVLCRSSVRVWDIFFTDAYVCSRTCVSVCDGGPGPRPCPQSQLAIKRRGGMTVLKWHLRSPELSWLDPFLLEWPLTTPNSLNQLSEHSSMHSGATPLPWPIRDLSARGQSPWQISPASQNKVKDSLGEKKCEIWGVVMSAMLSHKPRWINNIPFQIIAETQLDGWRKFTNDSTTKWLCSVTVLPWIHRSLSFPGVESPGWSHCASPQYCMYSRCIHLSRPGNDTSELLSTEDLLLPPNKSKAPVLASGVAARLTESTGCYSWAQFTPPDFSPDLSLADGFWRSLLEEKPRSAANRRALLWRTIAVWNV